MIPHIISYQGYIGGGIQHFCAKFWAFSGAVSAYCRRSTQSIEFLSQGGRSFIV